MSAESYGEYYEVEISGKSQRCVVGLVDMVDSTMISAHLTSKKLALYYEIFLNSLSKIISKYDGEVIKNIGDCLFYYFPESTFQENKSEFNRCLESSMEMIESRKLLCDRFQNEGLPPINYRISMDYGSVLIMRTNRSVSVDMIGPPINLCAKINSLAKPNSIVIGGDHYRISKDIPRFSFKEINAISYGLKQSYPVYAVSDNYE